MDRLKVFGIVALAVLVTASAASSKTVVRFGLNFDLGFPQDEFRDNVDNAAVGGGFFLSVGLPNMPFAIGASGDYMLLGSEDREAPFSHTVPDVFVDVTTKYNLAAGHLTFRMQPELGFWEPYIEALVGFHYLWTRTTVSDQGGDSEEIASTKHCSSWAFSYGVATGVMITLYEFPEGFFDEGDSTDTGLEKDAVYRSAANGGEADFTSGHDHGTEFLALVHRGHQLADADSCLKGVFHG